MRQDDDRSVTDTIILCKSEFLFLNNNIQKRAHDANDVTWIFRRAGEIITGL